jgi:hypothetical protein
LVAYGRRGNVTAAFCFVGLPPRKGDFLGENLQCVVCVCV